MCCSQGNAASVVLGEDDQSAGTPVYDKHPNVDAGYSISGQRYYNARSTTVSKQYPHGKVPRLGADMSANLRDLDRLIAEAEVCHHSVVASEAHAAWLVVRMGRHNTSIFW